MNKSQFVAELSTLRPSSTFLTLKGYRSDSGEVADINIIFNVSYRNALVRSIATLEALVTTTDLEAQAKKECIDSFKASLVKLDTTPLEDVVDAYCHLNDEDGNAIKGVKLHMATGTLHLYGLILQKRVIMPATYKPDTRRPLTVAKDKMRALTSVGKFRQFKITASQLTSVSVQNISLLPPE